MACVCERGSVIPKVNSDWFSDSLLVRHEQKGKSEKKGKSANENRPTRIGRRQKQPEKIIERLRVGNFLKLVVFGSPFL